MPPMSTAGLSPPPEPRQAQPPPAEDALEAVRQRSLGRARAEARRIALARKLFIALAALSGGSVLVFAVMHSFSQGFGSPERVRAQEDIELVRPRFMGRDNLGREFVITAQGATRGTDEDAPVRLREPRFLNELTQTIKAPEGRYDAAIHELQLSGGVTFEDDSQNRFTAPVAVIDTQASIVRGSQGVQGDGPLGKVSAEAYEVSTVEGRITLYGNVRGVIKGASDR